VPHAVDIAKCKQQLLSSRPLKPEINHTNHLESRNTENNVAESSPLNDSPNALSARYQIRQRFGHAKHSTGSETDNLNKQQEAAVLHRGSHLLILAGAGTGKTKTLIHRTADLLKTIPAENIAVMSFTIKAAQELYERLCETACSLQLSQLWIGTFHSICRRDLPPKNSAREKWSSLVI
jgi:ATP-dependent exoDNAse (exonuclease V) alpha subunit